MKLKALLNLNETKSIPDLSTREYDMITGIIHILYQVKDLENRKEIALDQIETFKKESIVFDYNQFLKLLNL